MRLPSRRPPSAWSQNTLTGQHRQGGPWGVVGRAFVLLLLGRPLLKATVSQVWAQMLHFAYCSGISSSARRRARLWHFRAPVPWGLTCLCAWFTRRRSRPLHIFVCTPDDVVAPTDFGPWPERARSSPPRAGPLAPSPCRPQHFCRTATHAARSPPPPHSSQVSLPASRAKAALGGAGAGPQGEQGGLAPLSRSVPWPS